MKYQRQSTHVQRRKWHHYWEIMFTRYVPKWFKSQTMDMRYMRMVLNLLIDIIEGTFEHCEHKKMGNFDGINEWVVLLKSQGFQSWGMNVGTTTAHKKGMKVRMLVAIGFTGTSGV